MTAPAAAEAPSFFTVRRVLLAALVAQAGILAYQETVFFGEMFRFPSTLGQPVTAALAGSVALIFWLIVSARLWSGPGLERFAASALAHAAALVLFHYAIGLVTGRLFRPATAVFLALGLTAGAGVALLRRGHVQPARDPEPRPAAWDAASALVLATLFVPAVFPYIHYDTKLIWACRAFALEKAPLLASLAGCLCPTYPPAWSILLWLGIDEPIFQGRLLVWLLLPLFALLFRARLARAEASLAAPALLFTLVTVHVWQGAATYYANVPLMVFLVAGSLLVLGLPRRRESGGASSGELLAGALCLGAAVLIRPDGVYYLGVVAVAAAWLRMTRRFSFPMWPFLGAALAAASWAFRPAPLRETASFFTHASALWRTTGATAGEAVRRILLVFLNGWQGQWLSHKGFGVVFYLFAGLALWLWRRKPGAVEDTRFFGLVSVGSLLAVMACYAAIPFFGDPRVACQPGETDYLACYLSFIRVGLGRMTVHLYPILVLWGVSAVRDGERS